MKAFITLFLTVSVFAAAWYGAGEAKASSDAEVVFYVKWYDVGKSALEGLKGVKEVKSGFRGFREINTVIYDPRMITPDEMVSALKAVDTYAGIAAE